jgi:hypothetical protein
LGYAEYLLCCHFLTLGHYAVVVTVKAIHIAAAGYGDSQGDDRSLVAVLGKHVNQLNNEFGC